jgi:acyl transferase domain-containing protein
MVLTSARDRSAVVRSKRELWLANVVSTVGLGSPARPTLDAMTAPARRRGRVCFVFDGNGSQWAGMGCDMLDTDETFMAEVTTLDELLTPMLGWSVLAELRDPDLTQWHRVEISQPLLFVVQAGIVAALAERGVVPEVVTGHSVGEVAAAYCAGSLDRYTACWVVAERTRAQAATVGTGRMAALGLGEGETERMLATLRTDVSIAAVNSSWDVTLCGSATGLGVVGEEAERRGLFFRDIGLDYPYHGPVMDMTRDMLTTGLAGMTSGRCQLTMISALTGGHVAGTELDSDYWWRNLRYAVRFSDAIDRVVGEQECDVLVEIGPRPVLGSYMRRQTENRSETVTVVPTMSRKSAGAAALNVTQMSLMTAGAPLRWQESSPALGVGRERDRLEVRL